MKTRIAKSVFLTFTLAVGIASVQSASAQTFKAVKVKGGGLLAQVSAGGASVWALGTNGHPYRFNGKQFVLANNVALSQISVGGGNAALADEVWALNSSGSIYRASKSGTTWSFSQVPGVLDFIAVGPGYQYHCYPYEVWGLNSGSEIYRYNFCLNSFEQQAGFLCDIKVGGGDIWGAECGPHVFRFNFSTRVFDQIADPFGAFPQLTVGSSGDVWAIDTGDSSLYKFDDFKGFVNFGCCATQVQAGNGAWVLDPSGSVYRWEPSAFQFDPLFSVLTSLSVGSGGGVWGLNSGKAYMFTNQ